MNINEFQKMCEKIVGDLDKKYKIDRNPQLSFTQLMEEVGELAKEINKPKLRNKEIDQENLNGEFADVLIQLATLANMHNINLDKAIESKIKIIKERHGLK